MVLTSTCSEKYGVLSSHRSAPTTPHLVRRSFRMALVLPEGSMDSTWGAIRLDALGTSPVVNILPQSEHVSGCLWEVKPFHYKLNKA